MSPILHFFFKLYFVHKICHHWGGRGGVSKKSGNARWGRVVQKGPKLHDIIKIQNADTAKELV